MLIDTREGAVWAPDPNPAVVRARNVRDAHFLTILHDDVLWDVFVAFSRAWRQANARDCALSLDLVRAELARRHAPQSTAVCERCLCTWEDHDDFDSACPDDERFRAAA